MAAPRKTLNNQPRNKMQTTDKIETRESGSQQRDGSTATPGLIMTPKEELAVICQRLKQHIDEATDQSVRVRLDIAHDIIRTAIHRR